MSRPNRNILLRSTLPVAACPVHFHAYVQEHLANSKLSNRLRLLALSTYAP
jgi:hypothetical protein